MLSLKKLIPLTNTIVVTLPHVLMSMTLTNGFVLDHIFRNVNVGSSISKMSLHIMAQNSKISNDVEDNELYDMAKSYFDLKEYDRCAFFTKSSKSPKTVFLHYYSKYLAGEKRRIDNQTDTMMSNDLANLSYLKELRSDLQKLCTNEEEVDGYILYLYGIILKKLGLNTEAKTVLQECLQKEPCLWSAWQELAYFINDRATLTKLNFPDHWTKHFFLAHCYLELLLNDPAIDIYSSLQNWIERFFIHHGPISHRLP